jgi:ABC-type polysaccharide/polyol phosphate transport system ATPase subunit
VTLSLSPGERLGVVGGNGSGKTTLLRTISGVFPPSRGRVAVTGRTASVVELGTGGQRELTGRENLHVEGALLGLGRRELRDLEEAILEVAALPAEVLDEPVYTYSAGMLLRLRLGLAVALAPDVLVIDEVLGVADGRFQRDCLARIEALCANGTVLVLASHDLALVAEHADRAVALDAGRIASEGSASEVVARHRAAASDEPGTGGEADLDRALAQP